MDATSTSNRCMEEGGQATNTSASISVTGSSVMGIPLNEDDITMKNLTEEEIEQANTIKAALEMEPTSYGSRRIQLTDYECVQWALTMTQENSLPTVLDLITSFTKLRDDYGLDEDCDLEEAMRSIDVLTKRYPGLLLSVDYLPASGNCVAVYDGRALVPTFPSSSQQQQQQQQQQQSMMQQEEEEEEEEDCATLIMGLYHVLEAMNPTFLSMKVGVSNMVECEGVPFLKEGENHHQDLTLVVEKVAELYTSYPQRYKETYLANSPPPSPSSSIFTRWNRTSGSSYATSRRISQNMKDTTHHMGYRTMGGGGGAGMHQDTGQQQQGQTPQRIDGLGVFQLPTPEDARRVMLSKIRQLLTIRYQHRLTFRLPPIEDLMEEDFQDADDDHHMMILDTLQELPLVPMEPEEEEDDDDIIGGSGIGIGGVPQQQQGRGGRHQAADGASEPLSIHHRIIPFRSSRSTSDIRSSTDQYYEGLSSPRGPSQSPE